MAEPTANERLRDALVRHQVYLERLKKSQQRRIVELLDKTEDRLRNIVQDGLDGLAQKGVHTDVSRPVVNRRVEALRRSIEKLRGASVGEAMGDLDEAMRDLAQAEAGFTAGNVKAHMPVEVDLIIPSAQLLRDLVDAKPFQGRLLKEWADTLARADLQRIMDGVTTGMVQGLGNDEIARSIVGTAQLAGEDGVTEITRRQAQSIARTATNFFSNESRAALVAENSDLVKEELYVATLDSRTTVLCASLDGQRFPVGEGPRPPLHFNCRSTRVPVFDGKALGERATVSSTKGEMLDEFTKANGLDDVAKRADLPRGTKTKFDEFARKRTRELTGQTPSATTYQEFLKNQTRAFQEEVLGKAKAKLFRDGGLSLDKFTNRRGDELSLSQLARKYRDLFREAGLDPSDFI